MRDMLFLSHANPDDNDFTRWLALRLANEGYPVWCDLTQLLGGEDFWRDAETAIRERSAKVLFVLTRDSNHKPGPLKELAVAQKIQREHDLADFVVPLAVDDLPTAEYNIELTRLNAISFREGWAGGLRQLLGKLERNGVGKSASFGPGAVASWWRNTAYCDHTLLRQPEVIVTNIFPLEPTELYFHRLGVKLEDALIEDQSIPYPWERFGEHLVSFASADDLKNCLGTGIRITESVGRTIGLESAKQRHQWSYKDERATLTKLLNQAWQSMVHHLGLPTHQFAAGSPAFYFRRSMLEKDTVRLTRRDGSVGRRQMIGYKTMHRPDGSSWLRYWHFAVGALPTTTPVWGFTMKSHVLFSDDGETLWDSPDRLARARRSQCKGWWNNDWRDLTNAAVQFLAGGASWIELPVGANTSLRVSVRPLEATSPVSYDEGSLRTPSSVNASLEAVDSREPDFDEDDEEEDVEE